MSALRRFLFYTTVVVAMASLLSATAISAVAKGPNNPNKPVVEIIEATFVAPNLTDQCGTTIIANVVGTLTFKTLPNGVTVEHIRYKHIFSGSGGSLSVNHTENGRVSATTVLDDGTEMITVTYSGTFLYHIVVPGHGTIAHNAGHESMQLIFGLVTDQETGEEIWDVVDVIPVIDAGPFSEADDADYEIVCDLLT